ncbi:hypothetical protein IFM89_020318 [Coptis chinensis]|uniref:Uncharacterized protein n=1 Tax=Coptis chinensis TaxID=261450 RepID=A0A835LMX1_9MAGN|nr:hypothetical protein IFM89_020318 [Coptis chinensis]
MSNSPLETDENLCATENCTNTRFETQVYCQEHIQQISSVIDNIMVDDLMKEQGGGETTEDDDEKADNFVLKSIKEVDEKSDDVGENKDGEEQLQQEPGEEQEEDILIKEGDTNKGEEKDVEAGKGAEKPCSLVKQVKEKKGRKTKPIGKEYTAEGKGKIKKVDTGKQILGDDIESGLLKDPKTSPYYEGLEESHRQVVGTFFTIADKCLRVTFCGYNIPHHIDAKVNKRVQTTGLSPAWLLLGLAKNCGVRMLPGSNSTGMISGIRGMMMPRPGF